MALMPSRMILWSSTKSTLKDILLSSRTTEPHNCIVFTGRSHSEGDGVLRGVIVHKESGEAGLCFKVDRGVRTDLEDEVVTAALEMNIDLGTLGRRGGQLHDGFGAPIHGLGAIMGN